MGNIFRQFLGIYFHPKGHGKLTLNSDMLRGSLVLDFCHLAEKYHSLQTFSLMSK